MDKPINLAALSKWVEAIPDDVKQDMDKIAPALRVLGYDPMANPPKYGEPDAMVQNNTNVLRGRYRGQGRQSRGAGRGDGRGND